MEQGNPALNIFECFKWFKMEKNKSSCFEHTKTAFPTNFSEILTVNYYDTYEDYNMDPAYLENTKGMPTTTHVKVIGANQWEKVQTGYDAKGRPVFTYKANHLGGYTEVKTNLDFRGKPTQVVTKHKRNSNGVEVKTTEQFSYDHQERLLTHSHQINDGQVNYLSRNGYDKLGQLTNKKVGGVQANGNDRWQNVNYKYNIRGWLTDINSNNLALLGNKGLPGSTNDGLFSFKIHYNQLNEAAENDFVNKLYNGNIAQAF